MGIQTLGLVGTLSSTGTISGRLSNATLRGERIELRVNENNYLQYRYEGQDDSQWQDLIELNNLNYEELINKPSINDITLIGNLTPADLGLSTRAEGIATISRSGLTYTVTRPDGSTFSFDQLDQENVIESVSVNGTQLAVNNKNVNVTVPTAVSQLTNDENYATQSYVDSGIDSIAAAMPTKVSDLTNDSNFTTQTYVDTELAKKQDTLPIESVTAADIGKALMPKTVSNGEVTSWEFGEAGMVDDVTINGTSIVNNKVAEIPVAGDDGQTFGVVTTGRSTGIVASSYGFLLLAEPSDSQIKNGKNKYIAITPLYQHASTFYGLAKAAGDATQSSSSNAVGTYTDEAKSAIQTMLGVPAVDDVVTDVQVNGTSILSDGVANIPVADTSTFGVVKTRPAYGIRMSDGYLTLSQASEAMIKAGATSMNAIVPQYQHESVFYGLAKIAGSDEKDSTLSVGTYTDEAKSAIQTMLGVPSASDVVTDVQMNGTSVVSDGIANIPIASNSNLGVVKVYYPCGIAVNNNNQLTTQPAENGEVKAGFNVWKPIIPYRQHMATFYGLAKAAGADEKDSTLPVGTYTDAAKTAIQSMLGIDTAIANAVGQITGFDFSVVQELPVSGVKGIIYLVAHSHGDNDGYDEYIWINDGFEKLGHCDIDLTDYATIDYVDNELENKVDDVQIDGTSIVSNGVAQIPIADSNTLGVTRTIPDQGIKRYGNGLAINPATSSMVKAESTTLPLVPAHQHEATFYGLAKASGDTTQSQSANAVGTYTPEAKAAIQTMLGIPAVDNTLSITGDAADAKAVGDAINTINSAINDIKTNTDVGLYGAMWDRTTNLLTRLYQAKDITTTTTNFCHKGTINQNYNNPFDLIYPWSEMFVCNVDLTKYRAGTYSLRECITAVYGDPDFTYKGTVNLLVGRYRPEFWYESEEDADGNVYFYVSQIAREGFKHADEAIDGISFCTDAGDDKVTCGADVPLTNVAVSTIHSRAKASGFSLQNIESIDQQIILYLVEYANMNIQSALGDGCSSCYRQNADDVIANVSTADGKTSFTVPYVAALYALLEPGAQLSFGATSGAVTYKGIVESVTNDGTNISVTLDRTLSITNGMILSVHGFSACEFDVTGTSIGNASGYLGTSGKANAWYRGVLMYANRYNYILGIYRQQNTNHLWICPDGVDPDDYDTLNTSYHQDTGVALPDLETAGWQTVGGNAQRVPGLAAFLATGTSSGSSSSPVGDQQYIPLKTAGNTILLLGCRANYGWACGVFGGSWNGTSGSSSWNRAGSPFLKNPL